MPVETTVEQITAKRSGSLARTLATASTRLLDLPTRYGFHFLIAARLAIEDVGAFYIVFSVMTLASGFGRIGVDRAVTREVAAALGRDQPRTARRMVRRGYVLSLLNSGVITALLVLLAKPIAVYILHKPAMTLPLVLGALSILPQNMANAAAGALAGLGRIATSQMVYQWLWPGLFCVCALVFPLTVNLTLILIVACMSLDAAVGAALLYRALPVPHAEPVSAADHPPLAKLGAQLFSTELLQLAVSSAPPFVLGMVASTVEVGRYALAWRIVLMLNLLVSAMAAIAMPQFARASARGDTATLRRVAQSTVGICVGLSALPALLLAIRPGLFLDRFGPAYAPAAPALRILLMGQAALILCAAVPELLGMTGHAPSLLKANATSLVALSVGLAVITPHRGDAGAAAATAIAMLLNALLVTVAAKRHLGLLPVWDALGTAADHFRAWLRPLTASEMPTESGVQESDNS